MTPNNKSYLQRFLIILNIIAAILLITLFFTDIFNSNKKEKNEKMMIDDESKIIKNNFSAKNFENDLFLGNHDKMKNIIFYIIKLFNRIDKIKTDSTYVVTNPEKNILLFGDAGSGKTHFIYKLSYFLETYFNEPNSVNLIEIRPSNVLDQYFGNSEKKLSAYFDNLKKSPYKYHIIFFDEIDALIRGSRFQAGVSDTFVKELQTILDGRKDLIDIKYLVIGTTNIDMEKFNPAIRRRFHLKEHFRLPSYTEGKEIVKNFLKLHQNITNPFDGDENQKEEFINDFIKDKPFNEIIYNLQNTLLPRSADDTTRDNEINGQLDNLIKIS